MKRLFDRLGWATLASASFGIVVSLISFRYSDQGPATLLIGVFGTFCVALFERLDVRGQRLEVGLQASQPARDPLDGLDCPYLRDLAAEVLAEADAAIERVKAPVREFDTEAEFFASAAKKLATMGPQDWVKVVCADASHRWKDSIFLRRWILANFDAVGRGVYIERVLVARDQEVDTFAAEQAEKGINVLKLDQARVDGLAKLCRIQPDMGIAVVNDDHVYIHWGREQHFHGIFVDSKFVAATMLSVFEKLKQHAEPVRRGGQPRPDAGGQRRRRK